MNSHTQASPASNASPTPIAQAASNTPSKSIVAGVGALTVIVIEVIKNDYWELSPNIESMAIKLTPVAISGIAIIFEFIKNYLGFNKSEQLALERMIKRNLKVNKKALLDSNMQDAESQESLIRERRELYSKLSSFGMKP
jgi:hypothetical protein